MTKQKIIILVLCSLILGALLFWFGANVYVWHAKAVYLDKAIAAQQASQK